MHFSDCPAFLRAQSKPPCRGCAFCPRTRISTISPRVVALDSFTGASLSYASFLFISRIHQSVSTSHIHSYFLNIRLKQLQFWVFFLCHLGELMNYSNLYAHFFSDSRAHEHFLEPTHMHEWKECCLEINFVWSCCWAQLELNSKGGVPNLMWLQRKIPKLVCWGAPWLHSRCLDPNSMWVFWPWSAGLSTATEPAWKFLPSDLRQFIRMSEVSVASR